MAIKKTRVEKFLDKLKKKPLDNDREFLECLMDLDRRVKILETRKKSRN